MKVYAQSQPAKNVPYLHLAYTAAAPAFALIALTLVGLYLLQYWKTWLGRIGLAVLLVVILGVVYVSSRYELF